LIAIAAFEHFTGQELKAQVDYFKASRSVAGNCRRQALNVALIVTILIAGKWPANEEANIGHRLFSGSHSTEWKFNGNRSRS
jgi:hypothetical protein